MCSHESPLLRLGGDGAFTALGTQPSGRQFEESLKESQSRLQALFEGVETGIFIIDAATHRIVDANPIALKAVGLPAPEVVGAVCHKFVCPAGEGHCPVTDLGQTVDNSERVLLTSKGERRAIIKTVRSMLIHGQPHLLESFLDITALKQAEISLREQTAYLNSLIEVSPLGIVVLDNNSRIQLANPAFERLFLYSSAEVAGICIEDVLLPVELASESLQFVRPCEGGQNVHAISRRLRKDGKQLDVEIFAAPLLVEGTTRGVLVLYQDVTERLQTERATVERGLLASFVNEVGAELTGADNIEQGLKKYAETVGRHIKPVFAGVWTIHEQTGLLKLQAYGGSQPQIEEFCATPAVQAMIARIAEAGLSRVTNTLLEEDWCDLDWLRCNGVQAFAGFPLKIGGQVSGVIAAWTSHSLTEAALQAFESVVHNVAQFVERKRAEISLCASEDRFRTAFEEAPYGMCMTATDGRFLHANTALCRMLGYSADELLCGAWQQITHPDDLERSRRAADQFRNGDATTLEFEKRYVHKEGYSIWASVTISVVSNSSGAPSHFITLIKDITLRKRAEQALRESELRYRELFENATDMIFTTNLDGRFTSVNRVCQKAFGYSSEEMLQKDLEQLISPHHLATVMEARTRLLAGEPQLTLQVEMNAKDQRRLLLEVKPRVIYENETPVGVQAIARDITGRDVAELELRQAQKLESVGRLASGIAHEINTPIQFVGDNVRFLQDSFTSLQTLLDRYRQALHQTTADNLDVHLVGELHRLEEELECNFLLEEVPKALVQTLDGVERVATIVRAMKEFAHPERTEMAAADLNKALLSTLTVARHELKYVAEIEMDLGDLPLVVCNAGDLNQVFLNLLVNSAHAIAEVVKDGEKGRITVRTMQDGDEVLISIADTGAGIPEKIRTRIYDPFFTTKGVGRGTGQGLAIAHSVIVERHKGSLAFESEVGKGTTFLIRIPLVPPTKDQTS